MSPATALRPSPLGPGAMSRHERSRARSPPSVQHASTARSSSSRARSTSSHRGGAPSTTVAGLRLDGPRARDRRDRWPPSRRRRRAAVGPDETTTDVRVRRVERGHDRRAPPPDRRGRRDARRTARGAPAGPRLRRRRRPPRPRPPQTLLADRLRPDLVLLDINLPGDTGWSLLRSPALAAAGRPPVVITSATTVSPARLPSSASPATCPSPSRSTRSRSTLERLMRPTEADRTG